MRKKFKKLVGITTAVAMAVSLVPTNVFAEEPEVAVAEESAKNDNLLRVWYDEPATDWQTQSLAIGNGYMGGLVFGGIKMTRSTLMRKQSGKVDRLILMIIPMVQQIQLIQMRTFRKSKTI